MDNEVRGFPASRRSVLRLAALTPGFLASRAWATEAQGARLAPRLAVTTEVLRVRRTGWAGVQFQFGDKALFIDPKLKIAATGDPRLDMAVLDSPATSRYAAITHLHRDHFDTDALKKVLSGDGTVMCHHDVAATVASTGLSTTGLASWEPCCAGENEANAFSIAPAPVADGWGDPQVAWIVSAGGKRFIHGGDTAWTGMFFRIGQMYGPFDVAFLPINGVIQSEGMYVSVDQPKTMTPEQAVDAAVALRARQVVPIHYGAASKPSYTEATDSVARVRAAGNAAAISVRVLPPGDWMEM